MYGKNEFNPFLILAVICTAFAEDMKVNQLPDKVDVSVGQDASLQCSFRLFKDIDNIRVYWWKIGEREFLKEGDDPRKMLKVESRASAALKIRNVTFGDAGVYHCRVEGEYTGNGTGVTLGVKASPEPMEISKSQDGSLLCKTSGFYPADYRLSWYRNGQIITNGVKTNHEFNAESLTEASSYLHDTQLEQEGTIYKCEVSHSTLQDPASATYTVNLADSPAPLKIVALEESLASLKLVCKTDTFYPETLEIFWRKNNVEILTGFETVKYRNADRLYEACSFLEVAQPARGKDVYTCLVSHISLKVPASFTYIVEPDPNPIILILTCAQGGLAMVALLIIFAELMYKPLTAFI